MVITGVIIYWIQQIRMPNKESHNYTFGHYAKEVILCSFSLIPYFIYKFVPTYRLDKWYRP